MQHHTETGKKKKGFLQIVWDIVFVFFYPIITTFALLFVGLVYFFSFISGLLSRLTPSKETVVELKKPVWEPFATCRSFEVEHKLIDEIMFGPAYYQIRTKPTPATAPAAYFGEFKFECFGGVLLQKWNTTVPKELPDFDLVFLDGETGVIKKISTIKAFTWNVQMLNEDTVQLKWITGTEGGAIAIHRKDVVQNPIATNPL